MKKKFEKTELFYTERNKIYFETVKLVLMITVTLVLGFFAKETITNINQSQEIVTIQPRDGDVIIKDGDTYKLVQLISKEDIEYSNYIQESRYDNEDFSTIGNRVDILNDEKDDWSIRDSFAYTLEYIYFNPDKIMNLMGNIDSIKLYFDFYEEEDISTKIDLDEEDSFYFNVYNSESEDENPLSINTSYTNIKSDKFYVTNAGFVGDNGINNIKLRLEIIYSINISSNENAEIYTIKTEIILTDGWIVIEEN